MERVGGGAKGVGTVRFAPKGPQKMCRIGELLNTTPAGFWPHQAAL